MRFYSDAVMDVPCRQSTSYLQVCCRYMSVKPYPPPHSITTHFNSSASNSTPRALRVNPYTGPQRHVPGRPLLRLRSPPTAQWGIGHVPADRVASAGPIPGYSSPKLTRDMTVIGTCSAEGDGGMWRERTQQERKCRGLSTCQGRFGGEYGGE